MMQISLVTDILGHLPFEDMLDAVSGFGFEALELGCGNWSKAPHPRLDDSLGSEAARTSFEDAIARAGLEIAALNCSGNQLHLGPSGREHALVVEKTVRLAEKLVVKRVVMMSGLPGGGPRDEVPNWISLEALPHKVNHSLSPVATALLAVVEAEAGRMVAPLDNSDEVASTD